MWLTIITFVAILSLLVLIHEIGHFVAARKFGARAEEFGFGFPPRVFGIYKNKDGKWARVWGGKEVNDASDTIYSFNALPLGGFVKIKGENGNEEVATDSFANKPIWQRAIILSAGVFMNIVLAVILLSIGFMIGLPQAVDKNMPKNANIQDYRMQIAQVLSDSEADKSGFKGGDIIVGINGEQFLTYEDLQKFMSDKEGEKLNYEVKRGKESFILEVVPHKLEQSEKIGIGIIVTEAATVSFPWYAAIWHGFAYTFTMLWMIIVAFFGFFKDIIVGNGVSQDVAGPVGIATMTGDMARLGIAYVIQFAAMLSVNLAVINFLPFPALDGGRVLFLFIEWIKGSPVKREFEATAHYAGFALLIILVIVITFKDITKI